MKTFFCFAITALIGTGQTFAQKIKTDETDKKTNQRFIEVTDKKIPMSGVSVNPQNSASLGYIKSVSFNLLALSDTKFLRLALTNTKQFTSFDIASVTATDSAGNNYTLTMQDASVIGKKRNMTSQGNETLYDNDIYLAGDFNSQFSKITIAFKDDSAIEITLEKAEQSFLKRSNLIISNSLGHY